MWQSIPRTGSLLLRASRPHSVQRFTRCLLSSLHASLPASSGFLLPPLSSHHASPPASSGFLLPPLLPPCLAPCVQRFTRCPSLLPPCLAPCVQRFPRCLLSPPSMPRPLRSAVYPLPALSSLHATLPASSGLPAVPLSPRPRVTTTKAQQNLLTT